MQLTLLSPRQSLNKAYLKVKPTRSEIELFKKNLIGLLDGLDESESEEHNKYDLGDFLKNTFYHPKFYINTKDRTDLVIHNGPDSKSFAGVLIEAKKPSNKTEMIRPDNMNAKAFHELILYYLRERITNHNLEIKHLMATNIYEWYVFDAGLFEKTFAQNKTLVKQFTDFEEGRLAGKTTDFFYKEIAEPFIAGLTSELCFTWFDFRDYDKPLRNEDKKDDSKLIALYKLLSPEHLLKLPFSNDSNSLDKAFYIEFLHIIGLTETKEGSKKLIGRKKEGQRDPGSLLENAIIQIDSRDMISRLEKTSRFGENYQERIFNVSLELVITWINRILFLKLLEAQLISYHKGDRAYTFLNSDKIKGFDAMDSLFFRVLAKKTTERDPAVARLFENVPYLNSALFEPTELEREIIFISNLQDESQIPIHQGTVLKNSTGKRLSGTLNGLDYLFAFLDAYDFSGEGAEEIQEENKTLINASILGLIFEKINGYKDGSFFTPGFITMYICHETIRRAVVQKFNEAKGWDCKDIDQLYDKIEDRSEANSIINSLKICDPAVGSGHFLVSALNEIIAIKSDLNILQDRESRRLKEYRVEVVNDELIVTDEDGELFEYNLRNKESQRIQQTLFHEKQTIIENCLFGVDINPNSVKICRLRLWIELLKNAYYKEPDFIELETLPNIDINIKCGNSLVSRYALDADIKQALKKSKWNIFSYRLAVMSYRNAENKEQKRTMEELIAKIKNDFHTEFSMNNPLIRKRDKLLYELYHRFTGNFLFEAGTDYGNNQAKDKGKEEQTKLENEISIMTNKIEEYENNKIFENAFEWRFEYPEVLNDEGDFVGFDVVIGNPPYFSLSKTKEQATYFESLGYQTYSKGSDIYCLFYERGNHILKNGGFLTYITSNSWLKVIYGDLLKKYLLMQMQPILLLNIEDIQVFEEATVESSIFTLQKGKNDKLFFICNLTHDYSIGSSLNSYISNNGIEFKVPESSEWIIGNREEASLKQKIERNTIPLKEFNVTINFGIKTGYNLAFVIDEGTKVRLITDDPKCTDIIKPILRGRDISKYDYGFSGLYLISTHNGLRQKNIERINAEVSYPSIFKHLSSFLPQIERRQDKGDHWTNLRSCAYWEDFELPKIIWGEISDKPKFAFDDSNYYAEATTFIMTGEKLKYLLAILNSKVSEWYFNQISTTTGMGTNRWKKYKIELLPIKIPTEYQVKAIESLVNQILSTKKSDPTTDTSALEKEIDQLVYKLYGLTEEEIRIIENG